MVSPMKTGSRKCHSWMLKKASVRIGGLVRSHRKPSARSRHTELAGGGVAGLVAVAARGSVGAAGAVAPAGSDSAAGSVAGPLATELAILDTSTAPSA